MANLIVNGGFVSSKADTPVVANSEVKTIAELASLPTPSVGLIVYVRDEDKHVKITGLKSKNIGGIEIPNAMVDTYEEFGDGRLDYEELGEVDLDDVFDQQDVTTTDVGTVADVDFDSLE